MVVVSTSWPLSHKRGAQSFLSESSPDSRSAEAHLPDSREVPPKGGGAEGPGFSNSAAPWEGIRLHSQIHIYICIHTRIHTHAYIRVYKDMCIYDICRYINICIYIYM